MYQFTIYYLVGGNLCEWTTMEKSMEAAANKFKGSIVGITVKGYEVVGDERD